MLIVGAFPVPRNCGKYLCVPTYGKPATDFFTIVTAKNLLDGPPAPVLMSCPMSYRIKNWARFQHFKDRKPPWIKLYRDLLDDLEWHKLDGDSAKLLTELWLIASERDGDLPDLATIAFRVRLPEKQVKTSISRLSHWVLHLDITAISPRYQSDTLETETETETEGDADKNNMSATPTAVEAIFEHWKEVYEHPKAKLDSKRRAAILRALKDYSEADLCLCISGYQNSPHHMGDNDSRTVYDDIGLFLRDAKHIDAGLRFHNQPAMRKVTTSRNLAAGAEWLKEGGHD